MKNKEIERKFLVDVSKIKFPNKFLEIKQGYLSDDINKSVRIRTSNNNGYITIKGITKGISKDEFEYSIPFEDANKMLDNMCDKYIIKYRYEILYKGNIWEVDVFQKDNLGLIVAEIELKSETQIFDKPDWVLEEVTFDNKYYNLQLITNPYLSWLK